MPQTGSKSSSTSRQTRNALRIGPSETVPANRSSGAAEAPFAPAACAAAETRDELSDTTSECSVGEAPPPAADQRLVCRV